MLTIPLAIPLMLFSMNIRNYPKMACKMLLSALFALVAAYDLLIGAVHLPFVLNSLSLFYYLNG